MADQIGTLQNACITLADRVQELEAALQKIVDTPGVEMVGTGNSLTGVLNGHEKAVEIARNALGTQGANAFSPLEKCGPCEREDVEAEVRYTLDDAGATEREC